jgi:predicted metal-dependent hydrolase
MAEEVYHFNTIGDVSFVKNSRAKSLRITVKPNDGVRVTVPRNLSLTNAFKFVEEKSDWIRKSLEKMKQIEQKATLYRPGLDFSTHHHKLDFVLQPEGKMTARIKPGLIEISYSTEEEVLSEYGQELIKKAVEYTIRKEAQKYLPERTFLLAKQFGFKYTDLRVKNLKSRWGSCSYVNNINLNIHLMRLPDHLIDYVILHELVHTVHKNHGKNFWQALDTVSGKARLLAKEMKQYRTQIY